MADLAQAATWHRQVAALAAAADRAGVGGAALSQLSTRLSAQQARFGPAGSGQPLAPSPAEIAAAAAQLGDLSDASVALALRMAQSTLDAAEAALDTHTQRLAPTGGPPAGGPFSAPPAARAGQWAPAAGEPRGEPTVHRYSPGPALKAGSTPADAAVAPAIAAWQVGLRNGLVYGGYTLVVLVVQIALFVALDERSLPALAPVCLLVLPAFAWMAGWFTIGAVFRTMDTSRTPRLGAIVCLIPDLLLCAGVVGLLLLR